MPDSVQHENIHMSIYRTGFRRGFLERQRPGFTHAFFPKQKFDEVRTETNSVFGKTGDSYIALLAPGRLEWKNGEEIIQYGKDTAWVCILSSKSETGSFEDFIKEAAGEKLIFNKHRLDYGGLSLSYRKDFTINGVKADTEYKRLDTPYVTSERKPHRIDIAWETQEYSMLFEDR